MQPSFTSWIGTLINLIIRVYCNEDGHYHIGGLCGNVTIVLEDVGGVVENLGNEYLGMVDNYYYFLACSA